jgi:hypothetical protein
MQGVRCNAFLKVLPLEWVWAFRTNKIHTFATNKYFRNDFHMYKLKSAVLPVHYALVFGFCFVPTFSAISRREIESIIFLLYVFGRTNQSLNLTFSKDLTL